MTTFTNFVTDDLYPFVLICMFDDPLPTAAPLVMHTQHMNGLRRSFLCRVKKTTDQHEVPQVKIYIKKYPLGGLGRKEQFKYSPASFIGL